MNSPMRHSRTCKKKRKQVTAKKNQGPRASFVHTNTNNMKRNIACCFIFSLAIFLVSTSVQIDRPLQGSFTEFETYPQNFTMVANLEFGEGGSDLQGTDLWNITVFLSNSVSGSGNRVLISVMM